MVAFNTIQPGDVLYSVTRRKMGNTTISETRVHQVSIKEVHSIETEHGPCQWAVASWNGNTPKRYSVRDVEKLRRSPPKKKSPH